jgi:hypothetical protein
MFMGLEVNCQVSKNTKLNAIKGLDAVSEIHSREFSLEIAT